MKNSAKDIVPFSSYFSIFGNDENMKKLHTELGFSWIVILVLGLNYRLCI